MTGPGGSGGPQGPVETLRRWEDFGGVWRVAYRDGSVVTLSLCRCDGGEEVERLTFEDAGLCPGRRRPCRR